MNASMGMRSAHGSAGHGPPAPAAQRRDRGGRGAGAPAAWARFQQCRCESHLPAKGGAGSLVASRRAKRRGSGIETNVSAPSNPFMRGETTPEPPSQEAEDDRLAMSVRYAKSGSSSWVQAAELGTGVRVRVQCDGSFELWRKDELRRDVLSCSGNLTLPDQARAQPMAWSVPLGESAGFCHSLTLKWGEHTTVVIHPPPNRGASWSEGLAHGFLVEKYVRSSEASMAEVRIDMKSAGKWFGGAHFMKQIWPLNDATWEVGPYYPFDFGPNGLNTLVAPQWVTSQGLLVMMDPNTPFLHVGMNAPEPSATESKVRRKWNTGVQNLTQSLLPLTTSECKFSKHDGMLRMQAREDYVDTHMTHPHSDWKGPGAEGGDDTGTALLAPGEGGPEGYLRIAVALCAFPDAVQASKAALSTFPRPKTTPSRDVIQDPIWTTWAKYKQWVNQKKVLRYSDEIVSSGLEFSVLEIDDRWQQTYGELEFDAKKFPDPRAMVDELHAKGFKVTLWVMPFVEKKSRAFKEGMQKGYFVKSVKYRGQQSQPGFFPWWNLPPVVALDVTNPEAVEWFVSRLKRLQTLYGIDGFKFDAGEPCFLPKNFITHAPISHPSEYTRAWVGEVASQFQDSGVSEVRTGHCTQGVGLMTRIGDRFSTWDISNGLQSIIPTVLTSGLLGYPFALPDIIGGNGYFGRNPDVELFVRWTQVNALMPAMQFSIPPWHIGSDAQALVKHAFELRRQLLDKIVFLAEDTLDALAPIVRPMWWLDPEDEATFDIFDQYALGDDVIVAPVVVKGQRQRDVYLTEGTWEDLSEPGTFFEGRRWLRAIEAPLHKLPCFQRIDKPLLADAGEGEGDPDSYEE